MNRWYVKLVVAVYLAVTMAYASPGAEESVLPPYLPLSQLKDPVDGGWLPNLTGLPDEKQIDLLTSHISDVMMEEQESKCTSIDANLRMAIFQHFAIHQELANAQNIYFDENIAHQWAHVLAMILKESSGDSTNVTDMSGRSISTYQSKTDLEHWKNILNLTLQNRIKLNYQTNFGLTQTSTDRLFEAFHLAQNQGYDTEFLEGKEGSATRRKIALNTAIAIRRLIWFYQDFAQGRIVQSDERIHHHDINKPEFSSRYQAGLKMALLYCGTQFMFHEAHQNSKESLEHAMASISYCRVGNQSAYGKSTFDETCFAEWVTLCPALNIDIALLTPLSYFETRGQKPVCEATFKRLIKPKPNGTVLDK